MDDVIHAILNNLLLCLAICIHILLLYYRTCGLKYTADSVCGLKFRPQVGSQIPSVGIWTVRRDPYCKGMVRARTGTVPGTVPDMVGLLDGW